MKDNKQEKPLSMFSLCINDHAVSLPQAELPPSSLLAPAVSSDLPGDTASSTSTPGALRAAAAAAAGGVAAVFAAAQRYLPWVRGRARQLVGVRHLFVSVPALYLSMY